MVRVGCWVLLWCVCWVVLQAVVDAHLQGFGPHFHDLTSQARAQAAQANKQGMSYARREGVPPSAHYGTHPR